MGSCLFSVSSRIWTWLKSISYDDNGYLHPLLLYFNNFIKQQQPPLPYYLLTRLCNIFNWDVCFEWEMSKYCKNDKTGNDTRHKIH